MHDLLHTANRRRTFSELLKKHVAAIHIKNTLSFLQRKIGNILLVNAYDNLLTKDVHTIRVRELAQMAGYESDDYQILKDSLTALVETTLEWNILNAEEEEWGISTMLAQAEIKKGICYYAYSPTLRQKLYNPEIYARINLAIQRKFSSGPALALYENCGRYVGVGSTGKWPLEKVKSLVGISENEYKEFKDLNKWVIKPGIQQVNKNSDILLKVEYYRERRRVVALKFRVQENPQFQKHLPVAEGCISENGSLPGEAPTALVGTSSSIVERLQEFGFSKVAAVAVMKRYGEDYIKENLNIVEKTTKQGR
jgi:replication initiator protein